MDWVTDNAKYIAVLLGILLGWPLLLRRQPIRRPGQSLRALLLAVGLSAVSVASAMLFAAMESLLGGSTQSFGAISTYGIYLIAPLLLLAVAAALKLDARQLFDDYALYALPSLFLLRINCLLAGCCGGTQIAHTGLTWPTRQAEMLFYAIMLLVLLRREKRGAPPGTGFPLLMMCYAAFRFEVEWFRTVEPPAALHIAHIWSVLTFIIGLLLYLKIRKLPDKERGNCTC